MLEKRPFEEMYLAYSDKIFRFLYWHTRDPYLAEDLTSDVFLRAWRSWERFDGVHAQAWLYRIARNLLVDSWRKQRTISLDQIPEPAYDQDLVGELEHNAKVEAISQAIESLPEKLKTVVILRFMEDCSCREVAKIMEISEVNVRVLQHRALKKLREVLKS